MNVCVIIIRENNLKNPKFDVPLHSRLNQSKRAKSLHPPYGGKKAYLVLDDKEDYFRTFNVKWLTKKEAMLLKLSGTTLQEYN